MNYKIIKMIIFSLLAGYLSGNIFKGIVYSIKNKFSWIGYLNYFILQWFFIRLAKYREINDVRRINIIMSKAIQVGNTESHINGVINKFKWKYKILKWILPFTGWEDEFIYINKFKWKYKILKWILSFTGGEDEDKN